MQEFELIDSILNGNQKDFERLVQKYESPVFRVAMGLVHNKEDAEEITQDVFLKAYRGLPGFHHKAQLSTWLYRITVNTALNFLRRKKKNPFWTSLSGLFQLPSKDSSAELRISEKTDHEVVKLAIDSLPQKQRLAFVLTRYEELPQKQVASIMRTSEGAVEQLVLRARKNLRKKLEPAVGYTGGRLSKKLNSQA